MSESTFEDRERLTVSQPADGLTLRIFGIRLVAPRVARHRPQLYVPGYPLALRAPAAASE